MNFYILINNSHRHFGPATIRNKYNWNMLLSKGMGISIFSRNEDEASSPKNNKIKSVALVDFLLFILPLGEDPR